MSKIEFIPLGGINEKGNNCYLLHVDEDIFVINTGIYVPTTVNLGIMNTIPDYTYLIENKAKIQGIFIGMPKHDNFGSLPTLINKLTNNCKEELDIPIFLNDIIEEKIAIFLENNNVDVGLISFSSLKNFGNTKLGNTLVSSFSTFTKFPTSFGLIFKASDNTNVLFIDEFIISTERTKLFQSSLLQINSFTQGRNNILILGVNNIDSYDGFVSPRYQISNEMNNVLIDTDGRVFFASYEDDMYKILQAVKYASKFKRPICFTNENVKKLITFMIENGFVKDQIEIIEPLDMIKSKNAVVLLSYQPDVFSIKIEDVIAGKIDGVESEIEFRISKDDSFVFACETINGFEKQQAEMFDNVSKLFTRMYKFDSVLPINATNEDHKMLISILQPQYIIPVSCLQMDFIKYLNLITTTGFNISNLLFADNGKSIVFENGVYNAKDEGKNIKISPQFIGSSGMIDSNTSIIEERSTMKTSGALIISLLLDDTNKKIIKQSYSTVGIVGTDNKSINSINQINAELTTKFNKFLASNPYNVKEFKNIIRRESTNKYKKTFDKEPLVIITIVNQNQNF
ncbi:MAG: ribonuclease J [Mycoplasmataceae bacterium]|jgi:ribonuclease J|nr:ribonuclease J [Mycoplasmataceae bacterium]